MPLRTVIKQGAAWSHGSQDRGFSGDVGDRVVLQGGVAAPALVYHLGAVSCWVAIPDPPILQSGALCAACWRLKARQKG